MYAGIITEQSDFYETFKWTLLTTELLLQTPKDSHKKYIKCLLEWSNTSAHETLTQKLLAELFRQNIKTKAFKNIVFIHIKAKQFLRVNQSECLKLKIKFQWSWFQSVYDTVKPSRVTPNMSNFKYQTKYCSKIDSCNI